MRCVPTWPNELVGRLLQWPMFTASVPVFSSLYNIISEANLSSYTKGACGRDKKVRRTLEKTTDTSSQYICT